MSADGPQRRHEGQVPIDKTRQQLAAAWLEFVDMSTQRSKNKFESIQSRISKLKNWP